MKISISGPLLIIEQSLRHSYLYRTGLFFLLFCFFSSWAKSQVVTVTVNFATAPSTASSSFADLKYNKQSVFNLEVDDRQQRSMSVLAYLNGGIAPEDGQSYPGKNFSDGCGNNVKYRAAVAVNAKLNSYDKDAEEGGQLTWPQLKQLFQANFMIENHGYYHNKDGQYTTNSFNEYKNINENTKYINTKLGALGTWFKTRVWVTPNNDQGYNPYADKLAYLAATSQNVTDGYPPHPVNLYSNTDHLADVSTLSTGFNVFLRDFTDQWNDSNAINSFKTYITGLKNSSSSTVHKLWRLGTHCYTGDQPFFPNFKKFIDYVETTANNTIWVTTLQEFLEYLEVKRKVSKTEVLKGKVLTITLNLSGVPVDNLFRDLSLIVSGNTPISSVSVSGADRYTSNNSTGLINIFKKKENLNPYSTTSSRIEAEDWSAMKGVQIEFNRDIDGGFNVDSVDQNDWMDYIVSPGVSGSYLVNIRVATPKDSGQLQFKKQDGTLLSTVNIKSTGGWQSWQTISTTIALSAGQQTIRVQSSSAPGWNINWLEFLQSGTPVNQAPTVNAGTDQTIVLPTSSVTLTGTASDPDGSIASYSWIKVSGPTGGTITSAASASTTVTGLVQGSYTFRLTVTDNGGATASDDVIVTVNTSTSTNQSPIVNAGADQTITLPANSVQLTGSAGDPDGSIASYSWSKLSGPAEGTISNASIANPIVNGLTQGTYTFRLTATDNGGASASDDVVITVRTSSTSSSSFKIEAENYTAMSGVQTEITKDTSGGLNVGWIEQGDWMDYSINPSSAGTYTINLRIANPNTGAQLQIKKSDGTVLSTVNLPNTWGWQEWQTTATTVTLAAGVQTIRIQSSSSSGWNINWLEVVGGGSVPVNQSPTANAGTAQTITLPASSVTLTGSGSDADGTIASYAWSKVSGGAATINSASSASTTVTGLVQGSYTFRLTVTDNQGATGTSDVNVTVNPSTPSSSFKIEAENYTAMSGIQTEFTKDAGGGLNVGWIEQGDWMDYSINTSSAGTYTINLRIATPNPGAQLQIKKSDGTVLSTVNLPNTWGWQEWQTISTTVTLAAGVQTIRVQSSSSSGWNINWLEVVGGGSVPVNQSPTANAGTAQTITLPASSVTLTGSGSDPDGTIASYAWSKVSGGAATINSASSASTTVTGLVQGSYTFRLTVTDNQGATGTSDVNVTVNPSTPSSSFKIEAENYTAMSGIQTEFTKDAGGGLNVGWIEQGDWMDYSINTSSAGT